MVRKSGWSLPVEVFVGDWADYDEHVFETVFLAM
jgi:hypothetical protein